MSTAVAIERLCWREQVAGSLEIIKQQLVNRVTWVEEWLVFTVESAGFYSANQLPQSQGKGSSLQALYRFWLE